MAKARFAIPFALSVLALTLHFAFAVGKNTISASQARDHIGKNLTVCGDMVSGDYAFRSRGQPTFLNLDRPYPNEIFTIVIWGTDRAKFGKPEERYRDKLICVTGLIKNYRGVPEIVVRAPGQIEKEQGHQ